MSKKKFKKVLVVLGGTSGERAVSLASGKACIKALKKQNSPKNISILRNKKISEIVEKRG